MVKALNGLITRGANFSYFLQKERSVYEII